MNPETLTLLREGTVIPAHPLALTAQRKLDERRQRALTRYYLAAGVGGIAVGVHTTQFEIRDHGLFKPVLALAAEEAARAGRPLIKVAGICGRTAQAVAEAAIARELGYDLGLLSLAALRDVGEDALLTHVRAVGEVLPLFGFYLQTAVGGRVLSHEFWRRFAEIPAVAAIKMAPFDRYKTLDVVRAVARSGHDIALYTGNDDAIVADLLTEYRVEGRSLRIVGGLLGHWSVWTKKAVELFAEIRAGRTSSDELLARGTQITDSNAVFFDAAHGFKGCIAGLHEVLRRQGLFDNILCLNPAEGLSPGQGEELDRVHRAYPGLNDDDFVARHREEWLR